MEGVVKCYCLLSKHGMHCPLTTDYHDLKHTFNYQVRGERIIEVGIDPAFKCGEERKDYCKNCPFK